MKHFLLILLTCVFTQVKANTYYISSSSGSDTRNSKEAQNPSTPWKSLDKLNKILPQLNAGDVILLKRGDIFFGSIQIIADAKRRINSLKLGAYGEGAKPILTGLQSLTSWTSVGNGIYETTLAKGIEALNIVLFNGKLQPIGRWPRADAANGGYLTFQTHKDTSSIISNEITSVPNFTGGEVVIRKTQWILDRGKVVSQNTNSVDYTPLLSPAHPGITYEPNDNFGFFFQNHVNALTQLGDWCYEQSTRKLKMFFGAANPAAFSVQVPTHEYLANISYANDITFDDIAFQGANTHAIHFFDCTNIQIRNCEISYSGVNGINAKNLIVMSKNKVGNMQGSANSNSTRNGAYSATVSDYSDGITVKNCAITNSLNNAINANNATRWTIENNLIENTGLIKGMGQSGDAQYNAIQYISSNSLVQNNKIKNTGYLGIHFIGDNVTIRNNHIDNFCLVKSDGGGIYTHDITGVNRKVIGNIVSNGIGDRYGINDNLGNPFGGQVHGIYLDGETTNVDIESNTCFGNAHAGLFLGGQANINIVNNLFYNNTTAQIKMFDGTRFSNVNITNNVLFARDSAQLILDHSTQALYKFGTVDFNYYCRPLYEPQGISTFGYPIPNTFFNYPGGGIISYANMGSFYSLDSWQQLSGEDLNTKKSPVSVDNLDKIRFEYNPSTTAKTVALDATYVDAKGQYYSGSLSLAPYASAVLIRTENASAVTKNQARQSTIEKQATTAIGVSAYPNPFASFTSIEVVPTETDAALLEVYDQQGRFVKQLFSGKLEAGVRRRFVLNAAGLTGGVYFIRYANKTGVITKQVTLVK